MTLNTTNVRPAPFQYQTASVFEVEPHADDRAVSCYSPCAVMLQSEQKTNLARDPHPHPQHPLLQRSLQHQEAGTTHAFYWRIMISPSDVTTPLVRPGCSDV